MTSSTLQEHLLRARRDRAEPLRVLVVHDDLRARKRVEGLLLRIRNRLGAEMFMACDYHRIVEPPHRWEIAKSPRMELVFLATSCSAKLSPKTLGEVTSLLPSLKATGGALAFLSGTVMPRQMDVVLVEKLLHTHSERAGVAFFSGSMPGLGCLGCRTPRREKTERTEAKHLCVLHAPRSVRVSTHPAASKKSKPTTLKIQPARPAGSGRPARVSAKRQLCHRRPGQNARS